MESISGTRETEQSVEYTADDVLRAVYTVFGGDGKRRIEEELRRQEEHRGWRPGEAPAVPQVE